MNILSPGVVAEKTNLSRVTIWREEKAGRFPRRVNLTNARVGWVDTDIEDWIASRPRGICQREIGTTT